MFDVAIVGGGPAGSWTAAIAGRRRRPRRAHRRQPSPRETVRRRRDRPCPRSGRAVGRRPRRGGADHRGPLRPPRPHGAHAAHRRRRRAAPGGGAPPHVRRLPAGARRTGRRRRAADPGHSTCTRTAAARWSILTRTGIVQAAWLIGADGPGSLVRRRVSVPFAREDLSIAAGYYVRGIRTQEIDIAFEDAPAGYLWSFPRPDHLAVGVCAQADETTSGEMLRRSAAWIDRHAPGAARERYSWPIPSLRAETLAAQRPAGDGWMLAGDAAGLVDPITREGIFFALASGAHAAVSLTAPEPARAYTERLRDTIYAELLLGGETEGPLLPSALHGAAGVGAAPQRTYPRHHGRPHRRRAALPLLETAACWRRSSCG